MSSISRDTIFISHATPQDNDFSVWLASRLELLGYKVWVDKEKLLGGETFWEDIDEQIRNHAAKFLLVYSKNIVSHPGKLKKGVAREYSLADSVGASLPSFIQLLRIDDSPYDLFIGFNSLNQISFEQNWQTGLNQLVTKLKKDNVPRYTVEGKIGSWYERQLMISSPVEETKEVLSTNILNVRQLPDYIYIYRFDTLKETEFLYRYLSKNGVYAAKMTNSLAAFYKLDTRYLIPEDDNPDLERSITLTETPIELPVASILNDDTWDGFPTKDVAKNYLKVLVKRCLHLHLRTLGFNYYLMSSKRVCYFASNEFLGENRTKVKFAYPYPNGKQERPKQILGKYHDDFWHFGVSFEVILEPWPALKVRSHITFTSDGKHVWKKNKEVDSSKLHSARRDKGKWMFNEEWRDLLFAFLTAISNREGISINCSASQTIEIAAMPIVKDVNFGFVDPASNRVKDLVQDEIDADEETDTSEDDLSDLEVIEDLDNSLSADEIQ